MIECLMAFYVYVAINKIKITHISLYLEERIDEMIIPQQTVHSMTILI